MVHIEVVESIFIPLTLHNDVRLKANRAYDLDAPIVP